MNAQELIRIYRSCFYVCAAVTAAGILVSVCLFFRFHIRNIWMLRSGKAEKKAVREFQESSRQDGRMREEEYHPLEMQEERWAPPEITSPLESNIQTVILNAQEKGKKDFRVTRQVMLVHTEEKIQ